MEDEWELFDKFDSESSEEEVVLELADENNPYCFVCQSKDVRLESTENSLVCNACGAVLCVLLDKMVERTNSLAEGSAINYFLPKSSLGTSIAGNPKMKIKQVNEWWKWVYKEKSFYEDKKFIESRCHHSKLSQPIIDNALNLYKKISECKHENGKNKGKYLIVRGVNRIAIMAAAVYYGAKMQKQPRSPKEIADIFSLKLPYMTRGCKKFLSLIDTNALFHIIENSEASDFVERFCTKLKLSADSSAKAIEIITNINRLQIATNHQPPSIAAASLLLMADVQHLDISKKDLHKHFMISEVTIGKTFKKIYPWVNIVSDTGLTTEFLAHLALEELNNDEESR